MIRFGWNVPIFCCAIVICALCAVGVQSLLFARITMYEEYADVRLPVNEHEISKLPKRNDMTNRNSPTDSKGPHRTLSSPSLVCYYTIPRNKSSVWELEPSGIDTSLCTHIIIGFASVVDSVVYVERELWIERNIRELRNRAPELKVMLSVGGMSEIQGGFPEMVKNESNRKRFVKSSIDITKVLNLDGIDLDWEFPAWTNGDDRQRALFVDLLREMRQEFDLQKKNLLLSVAVAAPVTIIDKSYDIPGIAKYVDFVSLMSYDYHAYVWYVPITGHNAPLFPRDFETGYENTLNLNYSATYWISKGMPREKLVIGIPTYGHSFTLANPSNHDLSAPATGFGKLGIEGFVLYTDVCLFLEFNATRRFDSECKVPYAYSMDEWISYDDLESVEFKAAWIKSQEFRGAMIFSLNSDDWNGSCSKTEKTTFPLTRIINRTLRHVDSNQS